MGWAGVLARIALVVAGVGFLVPVGAADPVPVPAISADARTWQQWPAAAGHAAAIEARLAQADADTAARLAPLLPEARRLAALAQFTAPDDDALRVLADRVGRVTTAAELGRSFPGQTRHGLTLFPMPSTAKVFRDQMPDLAEVEGAADLLMVRHEYQAFQVVAVPSEPLAEVTVEATPLTGVADAALVLDAGHVTINPVGYIEAVGSYLYQDSRDAWWPDPLVHNQPLTLAGQLQPYWITVYAPAEQAPGVYQGRIRFLSQGRLLNEQPFQVTIAPPVLPVRNTMKTFYHYNEPVAVDPARQDALRRQGYEFFLRHRLNPISMYLNAQFQPRSIPHLEDLQFCLDRGLNLVNLWYLYDYGLRRYPGSPECALPNPVKPGSFRDEYLAEIVAFVRRVKPVYEAAGCWDMVMVNGFDEIMHVPREVAEAKLEEADRVCRYLRRELPDVRLSNIGQRMRIDPEIMDIWWMLPTPRETFADLQAMGKEVCLYWVAEDPSYMLDQPGIAARMTAWVAFSQGVTGMGYYSTTRVGRSETEAPRPENAPTGIDWPKDVFNPVMRTGWLMCGQLLYPDRDGGHLSSVRFENLRDGIQDYELLAMLKARRPESPLLTIPESIVSLRPGVYTRRYRDLSDYRRRVIAELEN